MRATNDNKRLRRLRRRASATAHVAALVIISRAAGHGCARARRLRPLTNYCAGAPLLTTVVVDGSTRVRTRRSCSPPIATSSASRSRATRRAPSSTRWSRCTSSDGYVRPELTLDDSLTGRGVLRVQVFEPQVTRVSLRGRYRPVSPGSSSGSAQAPRAGAAAAQGRRAGGAARAAADRRRRGHRQHAPRRRGAQCIRAGGARRSSRRSTAWCA